MSRFPRSSAPGEKLVLGTLARHERLRRHFAVRVTRQRLHIDQLALRGGRLILIGGRRFRSGGVGRWSGRGGRVGRRGVGFGIADLAASDFAVLDFVPPDFAPLDGTPAEGGGVDGDLSADAPLLEATSPSSVRPSVRLSRRCNGDHAADDGHVAARLR